jgi:sugar phosphate isomerase/epimerase
MNMIGVQTGGLTGLYGVDGAYRAIREAGFDAADVNLDEALTYQDIVNKRRPPAFEAEGQELLRSFRPYKDAAEKYGVCNYQAHAPFPSWRAGEDEYNGYLMRVLEKTIAVCAYIGCSRLVIHPFFAQYDLAMSPEEEWAMNLDRYARLIPAAKKHGVRILLENMFTRHKKIYAACCSDFETACRYVDELNRSAGEELFGFCLDTGHALLVSKDIRDVMTLLGSRVKAFHIHDNNGADDLHVAPYMGVLDWDRFIEGLRIMGYQGALCFETHGAIKVFHPDLAPEVLRLIARTGRLFARKAGMEA